MIVRTARAKVGHCQAPLLQNAPVIRRGVLFLSEPRNFTRGLYRLLHAIFTATADQHHVVGWNDRVADQFVFATAKAVDASQPFCAFHRRRIDAPRAEYRRKQRSTTIDPVDNFEMGLHGFDASDRLSFAPISRCRSTSCTFHETDHTLHEPGDRIAFGVSCDQLPLETPYGLVRSQWVRLLRCVPANLSQCAAVRDACSVSDDFQCIACCP